MLNWGGLRGAIGLALALSLPASLGPSRDQIQIMAFGVVLFSLLAQSTTMKPLLRRLKIITRSPAQIEYELRHARLMAFRAAATHLDQIHREGFLSTYAWEGLRPELLDRITDLGQAVRQLLMTNPALAAEELKDARRELLRAERGALMGLRRDGVISEEVFEQLVVEVDAAMTTDSDVTTASVVARLPHAGPEQHDAPASE